MGRFGTSQLRSCFRLPVLSMSSPVVSPPQQPAASGSPGAGGPSLTALQEEEERLLNSIKGYEEEGNLAQAQDAVEKLKLLRITLAKKAHRAASEEMEQRISELRAQQQTEVERFLSVWDQKLAEYESQSEQILQATKERLRLELEEQQNRLRSKLDHKPHHFSSTLLGMKKSFDLLVRQKDYAAAEALRKRMTQLEKEEETLALARADDALRKKVDGVLKRQRQELTAMEQRIRMGRDDLKLQRRTELERLLKSHANVVMELQSETRVGQARRATALQKQSDVVSSTPRRVNLDRSVVQFWTIGTTDSAKGKEASGAELDRSSSPRTPAARGSPPNKASPMP